MGLLYRFVIFLCDLLIPVVSIVNKKIRAGMLGRKSTFAVLQGCISANDKTLWFHCASLGEFEQGRPVFESIVSQYPNHKVVLSFFSPSGFENCPKLDWITTKVYLPLDSKSNAKKFMTQAHPSLAVFVKYDVWPNHLRALYRTGGRAILISAVFKSNQIYFQWYGKMFAAALNAFEHIFVQDNASKELLNESGFSEVTVSGDTRYDRVLSQKTLSIDLPDIEQFVDNQLCFVAGSIWPEDVGLLSNFINIPNGPKCILVPHEIDAAAIKQLQKQLSRTSVLYSKRGQVQIADYSVLIIDCVGLLSKIYHFADVAYVGGAAGTSGLHNVLEPAVFGCPVVIGKNYHKFPEAKALIRNGGLKSVSHPHDLYQTVSSLMEDVEERQNLGQLNAKFIASMHGATAIINTYLTEQAL